MNTPYIERLAKAGTALLVILSFFFLVLAVNALKENRFIGGGVPVSNTVTVSGEGEVFAVPDIAEFTYSVLAEAATVADAQEASAEKSNAIITFLKGEGIDEKDIKTIGYSANPKYEWRSEPATGRESMPMETQSSGAGVSGSMGIAYPDYYYPPQQNQVLVGYEVRQTVTVKVRDTEEAGALIAGVGERGATDIYGPNFTIDDETVLKREARQEAIGDAREKAEQLADDLDVRLVRIVSFSESGDPWPVYYGRGGFDVAVAEEAKVIPEPPTGENQIPAPVSIPYEIR